MHCTIAELPVKAHKQRMGFSLSNLISQLNIMFMNESQGKPEMPKDISLRTSRDMLGYVCVIFSNIIIYSIPLAESKNGKPNISNAPVNFGPHILEVLWMTLAKK